MEEEGEGGRGGKRKSTMVQNSLLFQQLIIHFPSNLGVSEQTKESK